MPAPRSDGILQGMSRPSSPISISTDASSRTPPASPISISSTDFSETFSGTGFTVVDDPCVTLASTIPTGPAPILPLALSPAGMAVTAQPSAGTVAAQLATQHDPSAATVTFPPIPPAGVVTAAILNAGPPASDERWYCVTVGRQVGVFQGVYVFLS
jgi:hypothetical protein